MVTTRATDNDRIVTGFMTQLAGLVASLVALDVDVAHVDPSAQLDDAQAQSTVAPAVASLRQSNRHIVITDSYAGNGGDGKRKDQHGHPFRLLHCHSLFCSE